MNKNSRTKSIAYLTSTRADFGIIYPLLCALKDDFYITLIITGAWMLENFTTPEPRLKEFKSVTLPLNLKALDITNIINSMGSELVGINALLEELSASKRCDALMLLGDRYEILPPAIAAYMRGIPIIHLHGGEQTLGNYDEGIRHAVSKFASLHLVSTKAYKNRVVQLGENPASVVNIGSLGAMNAAKEIEKIESKSHSKIKTDSHSKDCFVVLFHPETLSSIPPLAQLETVLSALETYKDEYKFLFIGGNIDNAGDVLSKRLKAFASSTNSKFTKSLSPKEYFKALFKSRLLVGNSSSGIIEAPSCHCVAINIGDRQRGRIKATSTLDARLETKDIIEKIAYGLGHEEELLAGINPYFKPNSLELGRAAISQFMDGLKENSPHKTAFYDLGLNENG